MSEPERLQPETCFACGTANPHGLHVTFEPGDAGSVGRFTPSEHHEGWPGIVHGGILSALMDEAMAYALWYAGIRAVTARMEARFRRAVGAGERVVVRGEVVKDLGKAVDARAFVSTESGAVIAEANGRFMRADVDY